MPPTNFYLRSLREAKVYDDWKVARLDPIFKKDDESDRGNYRELSMLSVPSKILESCVTDSIVDHVITGNQLVTEYHWAYRKGHSTDLLLAYLSRSFRPGTKGSTCGKWFIDYNFGKDDGAESKFVTHKELIVVNTVKYRYCANKSRDMSHGHFAKNCKLLTDWWPV